MHPIILIVPAAALLLGPRLWVRHVLKQHSLEDETLPATAAELARGWLDQNGLSGVSVEITDLSDHYDPEAKCVRLSRENFNRRSLTAVTTAAHEVSHAIQDAISYAPFVWRSRLVKLALVTGQVGTLALLTIPVAALLSKRQLPPTLVGGTLFAMLGSGLAAQLIALPTELDASFQRAMPMLQDGVVPEGQLPAARKILFACSLTYLSSTLLSVLNFWPWLGRGGGVFAPVMQLTAQPITTATAQRGYKTDGARPVKAERPIAVRRPTSEFQLVIWTLAKPVIRTWFRLSRR